MGRPVKLRECTACLQKKPARAFGNKTMTRCAECRGQLGRPIAQARDPVDFIDPGFERRQRAVEEIVALYDTLPLVLSLAPPVVRCTCCWSFDEAAEMGRPSIMRQINGQLFCCVCAYQISACGRCETHKSRLFIPELISNVVPMVPQEILNLKDPPPPRLDVVSSG